MNFVLESYCIIRTLVDFVFPPCLLLLVLLQVFLSLSFDEDLGRAARNDEKHKPQSKKSKKKKHYEEARQLKENDKKRSRQELLTKTREEVAADYEAVALTPDVMERRGMQTEALSVVFETHFRNIQCSHQLPEISPICFGPQFKWCSCFSPLGTQSSNPALSSSCRKYGLKYI